MHSNSNPNFFEICPSPGCTRAKSENGETCEECEFDIYVENYEADLLNQGDDE